MNSGTQTAIINGKKVVVPGGITVAEARKNLQPIVGTDKFLVEDPTVGTKLLAEQDRLKAGQRYWTIPQIVKG